MKSEATILLDVQSKTFYRSESQIKNETSLVFGEAWMTNIYIYFRTQQWLGIYENNNTCCHSRHP